VVSASARGYAGAHRFAERHARGRRVWAVEGAGHYDAGLARYLGGLGETVLEVGRPAREERRLSGKDDPLDAIRAAPRRTRGRDTDATAVRRAAGGAASTAARASQRRRRRRHALVQLRSLIVTAPAQLREELRQLPVTQLIRRCSRFRRSHSRTPDELATVLALRSPARRIETATEAR
jgi:hypothetical protein